MYKQVWDFLNRHSLATIGVITAISLLVEFWLFRQSLFDWWSKFENKRNLVFVFFVFWLVLFSALLLWKFLNWSLLPSTYKERQDLLELLVKILGGIVIVFGVYATWKNLEILQRNFELAQEGQLADRFAKAIEKLGDKAPAVQLGGIYSLEQIANSYHDDYYTQTVQTLTAYVRMKYAWPQKAATPSGSPDPATTVTTVTPVSIDRQAILTFVGEYPIDKKRGRLTLSHIELSNVNLAKCNSKKNDNKCNLADINFSETHASGADFSGAILNNQTSFQKSVLENAVRFVEANLEGANFTHAIMPGAVMHRAILKNATFDSTNLEKANLTESDLTGANFRGALLMGANLSKAQGLTQPQIDAACTDENTKLTGLRGSSRKVLTSNGQKFCQ